MKRIEVIVAAFLLVPSLLPALGSAEARQFDEFIGSPSRIEVRVGSIDINVSRSTEGGRFEAVVDSRRTVDVDQRGDLVAIEVRGNVRGRSVRERIDLAVPNGIELVISVGSADVAIDSPSFAFLRIEGGSSDIRVVDVTGEVDIRTGSGEIELDSVEGSVTIAAQSGDVDLWNVVGVRSVETGSGEITGRGVRAGETITLTTGSGDIDVSFDHSEDELTVIQRAGSGDLRFNGTLAERSLESGSGPIEVRATTSSGDQRIRSR